MKKLLLIILSYIFIFNPVPPLLRIGSVKFLFLLLPLLFTKTYKQSLSDLKPYIVSYVVLLLYILFRTFIGGYSSIFYTSFIALIESVFISYIVIKLHDLHKVDLLKSFFICGVIAVIISLLSLLFPSFNDFIKTYLSLVPDEDVTFYAFRGFGMGSELTFSYAIVIAVIFSIYLLNYKLNFTLFVLTIFAAIAILINARTGAFVLSIGILFTITTNIKSSIKYTAILIVLFPFIIYAIRNINPETFDFMEQFYYEVGDILNGTENARANTAGTLLETQVNYGNSISDMLFGRGISLYTIESEQRTDMGYDNQFVYGGICYMFLLANLMFVQFKRSWTNVKMISLFLLLTALFVNIKGEFVPTASGYRLIACLFIYYGTFNNKQLKEK